MYIYIYIYNPENKASAREREPPTFFLGNCSAVQDFSRGPTRLD